MFHAISLAFYASTRRFAVEKRHESDLGDDLATCRALLRVTERADPTRDSLCRCTVSQHLATRIVDPHTYTHAYIRMLAYSSAYLGARDYAPRTHTHTCARDIHVRYVRSLFLFRICLSRCGELSTLSTRSRSLRSSVDGCFESWGKNQKDYRSLRSKSARVFARIWFVIAARDSPFCFARRKNRVGTRFSRCMRNANDVAAR